MRSPLKEEITVLKVIGSKLGQQMIVCGCKKGSLQIYQLVSGLMLAEVSSAHYLSVTDIDVSVDLLISGGKDSKARIWVLADLISNNEKPYHEFGEATSEITAVKIAAMGKNAYTCSLDKTCRIYDLGALI